ncbi:MAG TPA: hypothetical protein VLO30_09330 [Chthoniobacterales bacterium]|nr:hypothetical protein [Chthoniobacterales bacterium]
MIRFNSYAGNPPRTMERIVEEELAEMEDRVTVYRSCWRKRP